MTMREIHCSAVQVADAVLALINSRPQTPRREEVAAVFAKVLPSAEVGVPKRQAEWDALSAEVGAADGKCRALSDATNITRLEGGAARRRIAQERNNFQLRSVVMATSSA